MCSSRRPLALALEEPHSRCSPSGSPGVISATAETRRNRDQITYQVEVYIAKQIRLETVLLFQARVEHLVTEASHLQIFHETSLNDDISATRKSVEKLNRPNR